ncbi:hypothetical protein PAERUG_P44_Wales_1_VIM_2_11_12_01009 [Pseudomonas aeruginosa]|nr:hypothetical protein PAERUG_P44_Wales_1_VIM_2_11_12_01009 [Pseudomonas aeruginosa]
MGQDVLLEQLENDQLDLDLDAEPLAGIEESRGQRTRSEGIALLVDLPPDQGVQAGAQVGQRGGIAAHHPRHHRVHRDGLLQFLVLYQAEAVEGHGIQGRHGFAGLYLVERRELLEDLLQVDPLDTLALEAQVAHGFEESVLFEVAGGSVGHFEEGVVGVVEQRLQRLFQLQRRLVAHLHEDDRQAPRSGVRRRLGSDPGQVHHIGIVLHRDSPATLAAAHGMAKIGHRGSIGVVRNVNFQASKTSIYIHYRDTFKSR